MPVTGHMRECYLAVVKPDETLRIILNAHLGYRDGKKMNQDSLYFTKEGMSASLSLDEAFQVMALMKKESPEALREQKERVVEFVRMWSIGMNPYGFAGRTSTAGEALSTCWNYWGIVATSLLQRSCPRICPICRERTLKNPRAIISSGNH